MDHVGPAFIALTGCDCTCGTPARHMQGVAYGYAAIVATITDNGRGVEAMTPHGADRFLDSSHRRQEFMEVQG